MRGQTSSSSYLYRELDDAVVDILGFWCAVAAAAMVAGAPFSTVRLCASGLSGGVHGNLEVLHDAFNVPLYGPPPITIML